MDLPNQYQRAVTPTLDKNGDNNSIRGRVLSYQSNQSLRTKPMGQNPLGKSVEILQNRPLIKQSQINPIPGSPASYSSLQMNGKNFPRSSQQGEQSSQETTSNGLLLRQDLIPLCDEQDGIIFARQKSNPENLVVFRTPDERTRNPERLNLDRRQLEYCPIIEHENRLRLLNYQNNNIRSIQNVENLPNLIFLDLYNNKLTSLEGPVSTIRGLRVLMAGKNRITMISNLTSLRKLDVLDLHSNEIRQIEGLDNLHDLRVLNLAGNRISIVQHLSTLHSLTELNLRRNQIEKVEGLDAIGSLQRVFLSHNLVRDLKDVACLFNSRSLVELSLDGNPITETDAEAYRMAILAGLPGLKHLDLRKVNDEERESITQRVKSLTANNPTPILTTRNPTPSIPAGLGFGASLILLAVYLSEAGISTPYLGGSEGRYQDNERVKSPLSFDLQHSPGTFEPIPTDHSRPAIAIPLNAQLFEIETIDSNNKVLIISGEAWDWLQPKRLYAQVTEVTLCHMRKEIITSKFIPYLSWIPSLRCLKLINNDIRSLKDLDQVLSGISISLSELVIENPIPITSSITKSFLLSRLPGLKLLNGQQISESESQRSSTLFQPLMNSMYGNVIPIEESRKRKDPPPIPPGNTGGGIGKKSQAESVASLHRRLTEMTREMILRREMEVQFDKALDEAIRSIILQSLRNSNGISEILK